MRQVIDHKLYDTTTAKRLHAWDNGHNPGDFHLREKTLYRTDKGVLFIHHEGGALTDMARKCGSNGTCGGEELEPVSREDAIRFLESHGGADVLLEEFADEIEEA